MRVVIGGMVRSGSTFSFNIAREVLLRSGAVATASANAFPADWAKDSHDHFILKTHAPEPAVTQEIQAGTVVCICTLRKPEDAIASWIRAFGFDLENGIHAVKEWLAWYSTVFPQILTIDYAAIDQAPQSVIAKIEQFITGTQSVETSRALAAKYDKSVLKSRLDELRDDTNTTNIGFSYYDKETFFHRRHISSLQSISASAALGDAEIKKIRRELAAFVDEHGELLVEQCAAAGDQPLR